MTSVALVADDHALFRQAVVSLLKQDCRIHEVIEAASFDQAMECLAMRDNVLLAIMDLFMPGLKSMSDIRILRETFPKVRVLILTSSNNRQDTIDAIAIGVHGFVRKTAQPQEISAAIMQVMEGRLYLPPEVIQAGEDNDRAKIRLSTMQIARLTPRQLQIMRRIEMGLSNKRIALELGLSENTVKVHVSSLYKIIGVSSRAELIALPKQCD